MKEDQNNQRSRFEEGDDKRYREVPWPEKGRWVFGPWCLLGSWPAVFGVVEEVPEEKE